MNEPSKVTKILVNKIHGKRKQDSKFWQSEFAETDRIAQKNKNFVEGFTLFMLFFIGLGIVAYGGLYLYKRYSAEFTSKTPIAKQTTVSKPPATNRVYQTKSTIEKRPPVASIADKPITQKQLDRAIQKALASDSYETHRNTAQKVNNFYYRVELVNGGKIEAASATRDGDVFTIKDRKGLVFSVNRKEIKNVKKIKL